MNNWELNSVEIGSGARSLLSPLSVRQVITTTGVAAIHAYGALYCAGISAVSALAGISGKYGMRAAVTCAMSGVTTMRGMAAMPLRSSYAQMANSLASIKKNVSVGASQSMTAIGTARILARVALQAGVHCAVTGSARIGETTHFPASDERTMRVYNDGRVMIVQGEK